MNHSGLIMSLNESLLHFLVIGGALLLPCRWKATLRPGQPTRRVRIRVTTGINVLLHKE